MDEVAHILNVKVKELVYNQVGKDIIIRCIQCNVFNLGKWKDYSKKPFRKELDHFNLFVNVFDVFIKVCSVSNDKYLNEKTRELFMKDPKTGFCKHWCGIYYHITQTAKSSFPNRAKIHREKLAVTVSGEDFSLQMFHQMVADIDNDLEEIIKHL